MNLAHDLIVDPASPAVEREKHLATWYTQGHSDGLGDRLLMFDNTSAPSWEILRFNPTIACIPEFQEAVRDRVERLRSLHHPAFPVVRAIEELGREDGLAVASTYATGVRLADALKKPRSAAFTVRLVRQLTPALSALQRHAPYVAHGALTADRIVITGEGRLTIREHMVGSALESLGLSAAKLWSHFGILAPASGDGAVALTPRTDVVQLGLVAVSLLGGRRIGPDIYPDTIEELLESIAERSGHPPAIFDPLRRWLERALQLGSNPFECARDANEALADLRDDTAWGDDQLFVRGGMLREASEASASGPRLIASRSLSAAEDAGRSGTMALGAPFAGEQAGRTHPANASRWSDGRFRAMTCAAAVATALVIGEAVFIARGPTTSAPIPTPASPAAVSIDSPEPGSQVWVDDHLVGATPLQLKVDSRVRSIRVLPPPPKAASVPAATSTALASLKTPSVPDNRLAPGFASLRTGGVRLLSPIEVFVLEGERILGSSKDGPIVSTAGKHEFELVNAAVGYRARRNVDIKAGQLVGLTVDVPNGNLNINAAPWATVWVDGAAVGDTPIGNLSVRPGQHEIVFRHPQLGERREKTIVRADGPTRVTANLEQ